MTTPEIENRDRLVALLQLAYSGELAAALAYRGHWQSLRDETQRAAIQKIENDEWRHRELIGEMLAGLNSAPNPKREARASRIGRTLAFLCHVMGWLTPMYGAGRLESGNIREYETAARYAQQCGRADLVDCLLEMAEVEWDHEHYFRARVGEHALGCKLPIWSEPPAKETIRRSFEEEQRSQSTPDGLKSPLHSPFSRTSRSLFSKPHRGICHLTFIRRAKHAPDQKP